MGEEDPIARGMGSVKTPSDPTENVPERKKLEKRGGDVVVSPYRRSRV